MTDELAELLIELGKQHFVVHEFESDRDGPTIVAAIREYRACADVAVLVDEKRATAWRTPRGAGVDVLAPAQVLWIYAANPLWTLRALLTLPPPGHRDAPTDAIVAPVGLGLPAQGRRPVRIRMRQHTGNGTSGDLPIQSGERAIGESRGAREGRRP